MENSVTPGINLAKNRGETLSDRILAFSLTIGRLLIIITETIALGAFLFRFGLDRQLLDLHDRITQEQAIVKLLQKNEFTYRNLQDRLTLENAINSNITTTVNMFEDITNMLPIDMATTLLAFTKTDIRIEGSLTSLTSLSSFVKSLKNYSAVDRVSLDKLEDKTSTGTITVSLTIYLKKTIAKPLL